jgi:hypothetical protein
MQGQKQNFIFGLSVDRIEELNTGTYESGVLVSTV